MHVGDDLAHSQQPMYVSLVDVFVCLAVCVDFTITRHAMTMNPETSAYGKRPRGSQPTGAEESKGGKGGKGGKGKKGKGKGGGYWQQ